MTTTAISAGTTTLPITATGATYTFAAGLTRGSPGAADGVYMDHYTIGSNNVLINSGTLVGGSFGSSGYASFGGVAVAGAGDSVTNLVGGYIEGAGTDTNGITFARFFGTVTNAGRITGGGGPQHYSSAGINLKYGGIVTNLSTGTISGGGIYAGYSAGDTGTIVNSGVILGNSVYGGVYLKQGGTVTNLAGGTISANGGAYGIRIAHANGTVTNGGTINGSVTLAAGYTNRVVVDPGAVFSGQVNGGGSLATLELASGSSTGTLNPASANFTNFSTLLLDSGSHWLIDGGSSLSSDFSVIEGFTNTDTIQLSGSDAISSQSTSGGETHVTLSGASPMTLTFEGSSSFQASYAGGVTSLTEVTGPTLATSGTITFTEYESPTQLDATAAITDSNNVTSATIWINSGFVAGDTLGFTAENGITGSFDAATGTLVLTGNTSAAAFQSVLDSVTFGFTPSDGDPTQAGNHPTATIDWQAADANGSSSVTSTGVITQELAVLNYGSTVVETGLVASSETVAGGNMTLFNSGDVAIGTVHVGSTLNNSGDFLLSNNGPNSTIVVDAIFGTYESGVSLITNPTTITSTGRVNNTADDGVAVSGIAGPTWTLVNNGVVSETASGGTGISFASAATITNTGQIIANQTASNAGGIALADGGVVTNLSGGTITGYDGIRASGAAATVTNLGQITAPLDIGPGQDSNDGISLGNGGAVINGASGGTVSSAYIEAYRQAFYIGGTGTLTNFGTVRGQGGGVAVALGSGTVINGPSNATAAQIDVGGATALQFSSRGTVVNYATISNSQSGSYNGVDLVGGGIIENLGSKSLIQGYVAVYAQGGATVTNAGTIETNDIAGGQAAALEFGTGTNRLIVDAGAVFVGTVSGAGAATGTSTLEFASTAAAGTISGLGTQFTKFPQIAIDSGAQWTLAGAGTLAAGVTLTNAGTLTVTNALVDAGYIKGTGASSELVLASASSQGTVGNFANIGTVVIGGGAGWDVKDTSGGFGTAVLSGFTYGDTLDVTNFAATSSSFSGGHLTLTSGASSVTLDVRGNFITQQFHITNDGGTGTDITLQSPVLNYGDTIDEPGVVASSETVNAGQLTLFNSGNTAVGTVAVGTTLNGSDFLVSNNGTNTTIVVDTVFGTYTSTVTLLTNPTTIASTAKVNGTVPGVAGVYGPPGTAWVVTNLGQVIQTGSSSDGIKLFGTSTVINAGSLEAAGSSVYVYTGAVTNQSAALISGKYGVFFRTSGTLDNVGTISSTGAGRYGVRVGGNAAITNSGSIYGQSVSIRLFGGGSLTNTGQISADASLTGANAVVITGGTGVVNNYGTILAPDGRGIEINGGSITNQSGGLISGGAIYAGIEVDSGAVIVTNAGTIIGAQGVQFSTGTATASQTAIDSGTIIGTAGVAAMFGAGNDLMLFQPGNAFIQGTMDGGGGTNTLEFASGATAGTLTGAGAYFSNFANGTVDAGATWTLAGSVSLGSSVTLTNSGSLTGSGTLVNAGTLNGNRLNVSSGTLANQASGLLTSTYVYGANGANADVVNLGTITQASVGGSAVDLKGTGEVSNGATVTTDALIQGAHFGVYDATGSVINYGSIIANGNTAGAYGVEIGGSGSISNLGATSLIEGYGGARIGDSGTIVTSGTIAAASDSGDAVKFVGGNARLVVDPGAVFVGGIYGGSSGTATMELASGSSAGTITGFGTDITNFTTLQFDSGAQWTVQGNSAGGLGTVAIVGFASGDTIDLSGFVAVSRTFSSNTLILTNGTGAQETLHIAGTFATANVQIVSDHNGGTDIFLEPVPTITAGATAGFNGGGSQVVLDNSIVITDPNGTLLTGATIEIGNFQAGDQLNFDSTASITGTYDAGDGVLKLVGTDTVADYQAALDSITYSFTPTNGDPTGGGGQTSRTIDWIVNDATGTSAPSSSTLDVVHIAPSVTAIPDVGYGIGGAPVVLDPGITLADPDSGGILTGATVMITDQFLSGDMLNFGSIAGITGTYNAGTLVLSGTASIAAYQSELASITYSFTGSGDPTQGGDDPTRSITWVVDDGSSSNGISNTGNTGLSFAQPPVISGTVADQTTTDEASIDPLSSVTITDPNVAQTETVVVTLSDNANGTLSDLLGGTFNSGTYVVSGSTAFVTQALDALVFAPTAHQVPPGETVTTTFTITASDSDGATTSDVTTSVVATAVNDAPTISHTEVDAGVPNQGTTAPFAGLNINDPDVGGHTGTLTVTLAPSDGGTLSVLSGGTFDAATGIYTLVGTISALNIALEDLVFTPAPPSNGSYVSTTDFTVEVTDSGGQTIDNAVTVTAVTQDVPGFNGNGTTNSISVSPIGTDFAPPDTTPGVSNEAIVSEPTTGGTYSLPNGYQAIYLGGTVAASLSDNSVGDAALVGNSGNDTISAGDANDTLTGGNGNNVFSVSGANDVIGVTGASTVRTSGSNDVMYADSSMLTLTDAGTNDQLGLSGGAANVTLSGSGASLYAGSGSVSLVDTGINDAIGATGGPLAATLGGSGTRVYGGSSTLTVDETSSASGIAIGPGSGAASVTVGGGATTIYGGSGSLSADVTGNDARIGLANGASAITLAGSGAEIFGGSNTLSVDDLGTGDTIAGSSGSATVTAAGSNAVIVGGGGSMQLIGGTNNATVYGGTGSTTVTGAAGPMTLYGGAGGVINVNGGAGLITYQAGPGSETLNAAGNTGGAVIDGGIDASGHDLLIGGSGNDSLFAGTGSDTFTGGSGSNEFVFYQSVINGASPHDVITDFSSNDVVYLAGYGVGAASNALSAASSSNGATTLTLSDNTQITFLDVASASTLLNHVISF